MPLRRHLDAQDLARAVGMLQGHQNQRQVALQFGVSQSVISRAWTRYQQTGRVNRRHAGGRQRATTAAQDRYLMTSAARNRFANATRLQRNLREATGTTISTQTVRNHLHDAGFRACRPAVRVPLIGRHRQERRQWCQDHVVWTQADWASVLFTDESRFCLDFHDGRNQVWRRRNERYCDATVVEHDRYGGGSVMVWAGISVSGRTDLYVIQNGSLTGVRYRDEILHAIVRPYAGATGPDFILMDWPALPPDLNPIEHAWDLLQAAVSARPVQPVSLQELGTALMEEWAAIPQRRLTSLIESMRRRCQAVIHARGGHTRY